MNIQGRFFKDVRNPHKDLARSYANRVMYTCIGIESDLNLWDRAIIAEMPKCIDEDCSESIDRILHKEKPLDCNALGSAPGLKNS